MPASALGRRRLRTWAFDNAFRSGTKAVFDGANRRLQEYPEPGVRRLQLFNWHRSPASWSDEQMVQARIVAGRLRGGSLSAQCYAGMG